MVVTPIAYDQPGLFDTAWTFHGFSEETGLLVSFGVDHRLARALANYIDQDESIDVWVENWQVLHAA